LGLWRRHGTHETDDGAHLEGGLTVESLVHDYAPVVLGLCIAHTRNFHDAEDIAQEVFLRAHARLDTLRDRSSARAWLIQIARRMCVDHYRRRRPAEPLSYNLAAPSPSPGEPVKRLHACLLYTSPSPRD